MKPTTTLHTDVKQAIIDIDTENGFEDMLKNIPNPNTANNFVTLREAMLEYLLCKLNCDVITPDNLDEVAKKLYRVYVKTLVVLTYGASNAKI